MLDDMLKSNRKTMPLFKFFCWFSSQEMVIIFIDKLINILHQKSYNINWMLNWWILISKFQMLNGKEYMWLRVRFFFGYIKWIVN